MKKENLIFYIINKEHIILEELKINTIDIDGIYIKLTSIPPTIAIKTSLQNNSKKYISILSEELGHHFTTTGDLTIKSKNYSEKLYKNKKERKAKIWAANFLISDSEFVQALNSCIISIPEMAEHFQVTEEIINYKISSIISDEIKYMNIRTAFMLKDIPYNSCVI